MKERIIFIALTFMFAIGCQYENPEVADGDTNITEYLIAKYYTMASLQLTASGEYLCVEVGSYDNLNAEDTYAIREKNDDRHFNKQQISGGYKACANEFDEIIVTSNADFNEVKSGESLADKVMLVGYSPYPWFESGCTLFYEWSDSEEAYIYDSSYRIPEFHSISKKLNALESRDLTLLNLDFRLKFLEIPEIKEHNVTVCMKDGSREFENTIAIIFE